MINFMFSTTFYKEKAMKAMNVVLAMVLGVTLSAAAYAGDTFAKLVGEKNQGALAVYPQKFFASTFGKQALASLQADENYKHVKELEAKTGFKLENDVETLVLTIVNAEAEEFYAVAEGKFDAKKFEEVVKEKDGKEGEKVADFKAEDYKGARLLSWKESKDAKDTVFLAFIGNKAVMTNKQPLVDAALDVVSGKAGNAMAQPLFAKAAAAQGVAYLEGAFAVDQLAKDNEQAKNAKAATINLAELPDKKVCLVAALTMASEKDATELAQMAEGAKMMFSAQVPTLKQAEIAAKGDTVGLRLALTEAEIEEAVKALMANVAKETGGDE